MNVAFIPVRGGSKSIPFKNIRIIAGHPLVYWVVRAANDCPEIDSVYVASDSERIRETVRSFSLDRVEVIDRSAESATDTASTESAMLEFAEKYEFDNIVLVQATSPLLTAEDLSRGFRIFAKDGTDSVLSVVRQKRFLWQEEMDGAKPLNYDVFHRPRRQEFDGYLVENGAFYITSKESLLATKNRLSGVIRTVEMPEDSYLEIDEPSDWIAIEQALKKRLEKTGDAELPWDRIRMFLTDCDGCLTDGGMYYSENGDELKKFNTKDGMGLRLLREHGILTGIITAETRELNRRRAEKLKLDEYQEGVQDKASSIQALCEKHGIDPAEVAYLGDDLGDLEAVRMAGIGCCVADGVAAVRESADYITIARGGAGAVRELADRILAGRL